MVAAIVEQHKRDIEVLCRRYRVRHLWIFGSAVTGEWDPDRSDLDFLVDLGGYSDDYASRYFGLLRSIEALTGRSVDLVSAGGLKDERDWFRQEIEATRVGLYDSRNDQLVA